MGTLEIFFIIIINLLSVTDALYQADITCSYHRKRGRGRDREVRDVEREKRERERGR